MNTRDKLIKRIIEIEDENILQFLLNVLQKWPINDKPDLNPALIALIEEGLDDIKNGRVYTQEEVEKMINDRFNK